ncbi:MAG: GntR family transcriptional regulator [Candidatus Nanopelagicales bacterium]|jgi:DNA-binding GntR family transcriptional regulator|nr:GntR family transcriptional regulator [Candidatus Nanopelagicales bacterium]MCU0297174.1 GntR family transcriptional regulator [Candidatus Nanopelagicales bacterium]
MTIADRIRTDLLTGGLESGQKIVQESLAAAYGVSRIPLREALNELAAEGLVIHEPNRGYFVARLSAADMQEVYRLRELLEDEAIARACQHLSDADIDRIAGLAAQCDAAMADQDLQAIASTNRAFHFAVFEAAGMPRLSRILGSLWDATQAYRRLYFLEESNHSHIREEHAALVRALRRRDPVAAVTAQAKHRARSLAEVGVRLAG